MFGIEDPSEVRAQELEQLQLEVMRFADEYVGRLIGPLESLQAQDPTPEVRLAAQNWKISQATAAYVNATGSNPVTASIDMVVLASLSRMALEDPWANESFGSGVDDLREAHAKLESRAWDLAGDVLAPMSPTW